MTGAVVVWRKFPIERNKEPQPVRTICEVLRELDRDAKSRGDAISIQRIAECYDMAKRMHHRLLRYKADYMNTDGYVTAPKSNSR